MNELLSDQAASGAARDYAEQRASVIPNAGPVRHARRAYTIDPDGRRREITDGFYYVEVESPPAGPGQPHRREIVVLCPSEVKSRSNVMDLFRRRRVRGRDREAQILRDFLRLGASPLVIEEAGRPTRADPLGRTGTHSVRYNAHEISLDSSFTVFIGTPRDVARGGASSRRVRSAANALGFRTVRVSHEFTNDEVRGAAREVVSAVPGSARDPSAARTAEARRRLGIRSGSGSGSGSE